MPEAARDKSNAAWEGWTRYGTELLVRHDRQGRVMVIEHRSFKMTEHGWYWYHHTTGSTWLAARLDDAVKLARPLVRQCR